MRDQENMEAARKIIDTLGVDKSGILSGLMAACANCERYGPQAGKPCMSLRLALDVGVEYMPPEWCRDKSVMSN